MFDECSPLFSTSLTYRQSLSADAAKKLVSLFDVLSVPEFVLAYPHNYRFSFFLLETFNNLLQYQYEGNVALALALIRNKEAVFRLVNLTAVEQVTTKSEEEGDGTYLFPSLHPPISSPLVH